MRRHKKLTRKEKMLKKEYDKVIDEFAPARRYLIEGNTYVCEPRPDEREVFDNALRYARPNQVGNLEFQESDVKHIMVNQLRHEYTNYEFNLKQMYQHFPGICQEQVHAMLKNATLHEISQAYPYLADTCRKQKIQVDLVKISNRR